MTNRQFWRICIAFLICAASSVSAQNISAELRGEIRDPSGAIIPNASILLKNVTTGITRTTSSNAAGTFNLADLQPANYEMTVSAAGFAIQLLTNIPLSVGARRVLDITLMLSSVESTVEVKAEIGRAHV